MTALGALPALEDGGVAVRPILGSASGQVAPATMFSDILYAGVRLEPGSRLPMPDDHEDRGLYVVEGSASVTGQEFKASQVMVFRPGDRITVAAGSTQARATTAPPISCFGYATGSSHTSAG